MSDSLMVTGIDLRTLQTCQIQTEVFLSCLSLPRVVYKVPSMVLNHMQSPVDAEIQTSCGHEIYKQTLVCFRGQAPGGTGVGVEACLVVIRGSSPQ
jgi:hypothetical protein